MLYKKMRGAISIKISVIIPTFNAGNELSNILNEIPNKYEIVIIDSSSSDNTVSIAKSFGAIVNVIKQSEFNHGTTRNVASQLATGDILVFLTQDAIPVNNSVIDNIIQPLLENDEVGMAYGRQLPHIGAKVMGGFARLHNYPDISRLKSFEDREELGIKTVFCSNSFSAYKRECFEKVGMFPSDVILSEDTYVSGKMLLNGYKVAYVSEAMVYHSHDYSIMEEFKRYFDIGVFYGREKWILKEFGQAEGDGVKFVFEQFKYLFHSNATHLVPEFVIRNTMKYLGYKLGIIESKLPALIKKRISMHKGFWN